MQLTQHFHGPVHNVYNVDGNLILSSESKAPDLIREIENLRAAVAALPALAQPARETIDARLTAAKTEGNAPRPRGATLKTDLDDAAAILKGATGAAEQAGKLAKTLGDIGEWAKTLFG